MQKKIFVAGSSGFIGGHLVKRLKSQGHFVIGADLDLPKYTKTDNFFQIDLRNQSATLEFFASNPNFDEVYLLAALMGGMGFIGDEKKNYDIMVGSTKIIANILEGCRLYNPKSKIFYSSSACVYNMNLQDSVDSAALKESDAYPAQPDLMYGWQKLTGELMFEAAAQQYGLDIRIARFHNIFGHEGIYDGGKEKAPAALARKIAEAEDGGFIEVWGDGQQKRSFLFIDECLDGVERLMKSNYTLPLNIGSDEVVSITELAEKIIAISGKKLFIRYDTTKPQGVRGRNSDNELIEYVLQWRPVQPLEKGLKVLYHFVNEKVNKKQTA